MAGPRFEVAGYRENEPAVLGRQAMFMMIEARCWIRDCASATMGFMG